MNKVFRIMHGLGNGDSAPGAGLSLTQIICAAAVFPAGMFIGLYLERILIFNSNKPQQIEAVSTSATKSAQ